MAKTALDRIQENIAGRVVLNAPMAELTTIQVGGPADILVYPDNIEDLGTLVPFLAEREIPYFVLGNGSNIVVRDGGIRGAVIHLGEGFRQLEPLEPAGDAPQMKVAAGIPLRRFVRWTVDQGIRGFEGLSGIPGTVGGALAMNAGAWGSAIGDYVEELEVMDKEGHRRVLPREMLRFEYRSLDLPPDSIILGARLRGETGTPEEVKARAKELYRKRESSQPLREPSAGCVFRNPGSRHAGAMIDECGLKGVRVGDAQVSSVHANYIVNTGRATAGNVVALMGMIQERVYVKYKVKLQPEVRIVGEWEKGKLRIQE